MAPGIDRPDNPIVIRGVLREDFFHRPVMRHCMEFEEQANAFAGAFPSAGHDRGKPIVESRITQREHVHESWREAPLLEGEINPGRRLLRIGRISDDYVVSLLDLRVVVYKGLDPAP